MTGGINLRRSHSPRSELLATAPSFTANPLKPRAVDIIPNRSSCCLVYARALLATHAALLRNLSRKRVGRPGLEPGTNPESFRGCSYSVRLFLIQCQNRQLRILFTFECDFQGHALHSSTGVVSRRRERLLHQNGVLCDSSAPMLGDTALDVFSGADVIAPSTADNVNPSHISDGSAGTRTRNQRLKRALLYRLSYRPD